MLLPEKWKRSLTMKHKAHILALLLSSSSIIATQTVTTVELSRDNGILCNQTGESVIIKERWDNQQDFDFSLELGQCPTVCGAKCPLTIISKNTFYIFKNRHDSTPLFGRTIDFQHDGFDSSSRYIYSDTIQSFSIPLTEYPRYMVFKATVNGYLLFTIDSLKITGGCPPEMPACCTAYIIDKIYGKIFFQNNGLPYFDQPVHVGRAYQPVNYATESYRPDRVFDILGRSVCVPVFSGGARITTGVELGSNKNRIFLKLRDFHHSESSHRPY